MTRKTPVNSRQLVLEFDYDEAGMYQGIVLSLLQSVLFIRVYKNRSTLGNCKKLLKANTVINIPSPC
jgi:hypothetical protein